MPTPNPHPIFKGLVDRDQPISYLPSLSHLVFLNINPNAKCDENENDVILAPKFQ